MKKNLNSKRSEESRFGERSKPVLKIFLSAALVIFCSFVFIGAFGTAHAQLPGAEGTPGLQGTPGIQGTPSGSWSIGNFIRANSFIELVNRIAGYIAAIAIPIAVIMIVWSGILFLTAGGDESKVTTARRAITWSVVGLAVALIGRGFTTIIQDILGNDVSTAQSVINVFNKVAGFMYGAGIAIAVIFLIWAGITYMTASGDEKKITTAKSRFWWGIIGAAIIIGAGAIIRTVINFVNTKNL